MEEEWKDVIVVNILLINVGEKGVCAVVRLRVTGNKEKKLPNTFRELSKDASCLKTKVKSYFFKF